MGFRPEAASPSHNQKERAMKLRIGWSVPLCIAACLSLAPLAWADATTSPGKNSVFVSAGNLTLPPQRVDAILAKATITKGRKDTVIAVEAMVSKVGSTGFPVSVIIFPMINGVPVEPVRGDGIAEVNCPAATSRADYCSTTGTWWLDIDAAEAANPGMFIGKPLAIELEGAESTGNGDSGEIATLTARVQKK
jgi:hypothetical protein